MGPSSSGSFRRYLSTGRAPLAPSRRRSTRCMRSDRQRPIPTSIGRPSRQCPPAFQRFILRQTVCALPRGLHFGLVHTNQGHVLGTLTAEPEVFQPLATCLRRQNELTNLALAQVAEFPPTVRIGAVADHHIPCAPFSYAS
jgi:hypothetical protein